jgi:hypothetical protein
MGINREEFKIEPEKDDGIDIISLNKHIEEDLKRKKNNTANEFEKLGGDYLKEIDKKKKTKGSKKAKLIPYILKHRGDDYDNEELMSYSFDDVQDIYNEIKEYKKKNKPFLVQMFHFLFNIE